MEINKKRTFIVFLIINLLMFGIAIGFYFIFISTFSKDYIDKQTSASQAVVNQSTNNSIADALSLFNEETLNNSVSDLNLKLITDPTLQNFGFLEFLAVTDNSFIYEGSSVNIDQDYLKEYQIGFFDNYFYVFNEEVVGVIDLNILLSQVISFTNANDLFLMSNQGEIYFNTNSSLYKNVLHEYLNEETSEYFKDYFSVNKKALIYTNILNSKAVVSFVPLEGFNNLYVAEQYYLKDLENNFLPLSMFLAALFAILAVLNVLALMYIFYSLNKKNADIENKKYDYFYIKPYILKINKKGVIKSVNRRIKEEYYSIFKEGTNVNDVLTDNTLDKIERGAPVIFKATNKSISFLPLKFSLGYYLIGEHMTSAIAGDDEVYRLAYYNEVTNIPNLHLFYIETDEKLSIFSPIDEEELYFIGFKVIGIEKSFGKIGDFVKDSALKEIASELVDLFKQKEVDLYNTEDDEFIAVLKEKSFKDIEGLVLKTINHFEKPMVISKSKVDFKVRAAIVSIKGKDSSSLKSKDVYSQVHETLKRAAESTHQKYLIFDEMITHYLTERQLMEKELKIAIENKEFIPYLQAQYNYKEDRITGFEALIRWDNPNYINKSPQSFINLAEETGMINDIGKIMTEKTFEIAKKLENYNVSISLNVSPVEILRQGFVEELLEHIKKYKLKPGSITLEITETTLLQSFMIINEKIKVLKRNGIKIDLDDFGTGYSSLPYIKELDFDTIKIDKKFVDYIETDKYNKAIVQLIISLAKTLNADVIAEGVETEKQMNYLVKAGCQVVQGYFISKPLPFQEAEKLLEEYNVKKVKSFQKKGGN